MPGLELSRARGDVRRVALVAGLVAASLAGGTAAGAQDRQPMEPAIAAQPETPHRTHLMLKDGSYQLVLSYKVVGKVVRYRSAERDGEEEEIPLALVDLPATKAWELAHDPSQPHPEAQQGPVLTPELAREEAARAARTPEVAPNLHLPEEDSVVVLDTFQGTPELVPLPQQGSDLNRETAHAVLVKNLNPAATSYDMLFLREERADVQVHVPDPVFFVRLESKGMADAEDGGSGFQVDTHGQSGRATPGGGSPDASYIIERVDVRQVERAVSSPVIRLLDSGRSQPDVIETTQAPLPGGVWQKVTPKQPLQFGEYVLIEVLNDHAVNADTWDFGVHPTAKENDEAIRPEMKKPSRLQRREP